MEKIKIQDYTYLQGQKVTLEGNILIAMLNLLQELKEKEIKEVLLLSKPSKITKDKARKHSRNSIASCNEGSSNKSFLAFSSGVSTSSSLGAGGGLNLLNDCLAAALRTFRWWLHSVIIRRGFAFLSARW